MIKVGIIFLLILAGIDAFAQAYQNEMKGVFKIDPKDNTDIQYTLKWNEENGSIRGLYSDNYFSVAAPVDGLVSNGRTFFINFRKDQKGVHSLLMMTTSEMLKKDAAPLAINVIARDASGNPLKTLKHIANASLASSAVQSQEEQNCRENFGALSGFCGVYVGTISEDRDKRNKCNLLFADAVRLEVREDATVLLHLGDVNPIVNTEGHTIGRLPVNPEKRVIDLMSRTCGQLTGVNSSTDNCKRLHLNGEFSLQGERKHFQGSYTISEENTNNICLYSLSMDLGT